MTQLPEATAPAASSPMQSPLQRNSQLSDENGTAGELSGAYGSAGMAHSLHGAVAARRQAITELLFFASVGDRDRCVGTAVPSCGVQLVSQGNAPAELVKLAQTPGRLQVAQLCARSRPRCTDICSERPQVEEDLRPMEAGCAPTLLFGLRPRS